MTLDDFEAYFHRIQNLSRQDLESATMQTPPDWGVAAEALTALADYLEGSRPNVIQVIRRSLNR